MTDPRWRLHFSRLSKTDPRLFFFLEFIHQWKSFNHFRKIKLHFFSLLCKGKDLQIIINPRFYFTDTRKQLLNYCNIYESAVSITSPLKAITDPLKEINWSKQTKKGCKPKFLFARSSRYNCPTFCEKKFPTSQSL